LNVTRSKSSILYLLSVPDSLFLLLKLIFGGQQVVEIQCAEECNISVPQNRIFNIVQDIVYAVSTHVTPKHVRLGSTLHQVTRSKRLVELFSNDGHIMNYNGILRLDTALAEKTLESMKYGPIIPPNLVHGRSVHFTPDNMDINEHNLDGKDTFHATQMAAWQRAPTSPSVLCDINLTTRKTLSVPDDMNTIIPANVNQIAIPRFSQTVQADWFNSTVKTPRVLKPDAKAVAYHIYITRHSEKVKTTWTDFNKHHSDHNPEENVYCFFTNNSSTCTWH